MMAGALIHLLLVLVIIGVVLWIIWWGIGQIPMPQPIKVAATVIFVLICVIVAIDYLLPLAGAHL
jgi:heme A synthase